MMRFLGAGVLAITLAAALGGCTDLLDDDSDVAVRAAALSAAGTREPVPLCRWMATSLRGRRANIYVLANSDREFVGVSVDGQLLCIDQPIEVQRTGVNVDPNPGEGEDSCDICEGTPLPAEAFTELVAHYEETHDCVQANR
jgi:hypothetical protein